MGENGEQTDDNIEDQEEETPQPRKRGRPAAPPVSDSEVMELHNRLKKPFESPESTATHIVSILARIWEHGVENYARMALMYRTTPGSSKYWEFHSSIIDSGLKVITAMDKAYNWEEAMQKMRLVLTELRKMKDKGAISEREYNEAVKKTEELERVVATSESPSK